jgi:hypothetical protein
MYVFAVDPNYLNGMPFVSRKTADRPLLLC